MMPFIIAQSLSSEQRTQIHHEIERLDLARVTSSHQTALTPTTYYSTTYTPIIIHTPTPIYAPGYGGYISTTEQKKREENSNRGWALLATLISVIGSFFLAQGINGYQTAKEVRKSIMSIPAQYSHLQFACIKKICDNVQAIENNRFWSIINRALIVVGAILVVIGFLATGPLSFGASLVMTGCLSDLVRVSINGLEGRMARNIQLALDRLETSPPPAKDEPCFYMPASFQSL